MMNFVAISQEFSSKKQILLSSLLGGASAGVFVDVILFPLDTLKTRMQAAQGFKQAGGFKRLFKGVGPQLIGGAPQAALFFLTYEFFKYETLSRVPKTFEPFVYMGCATLGELVCNLVRVPMEVVKQRRQTAIHSSLHIFKAAIKNDGLIRGLYRGCGSTITREVPFSIIQFSMIEHLKTSYRMNFKNNEPLESNEVAVCGAIAAGTAAAITTPLDVAKTRIMLAQKVSGNNERTIPVLKHLYQTEGIKGLFSGFVPRVIWLSMGGCIFFGMYDFFRSTWNEIIENHYR